MNKNRFIVLAGMTLLAAASRLLPHPPNFSPIAALALFGGAQFSNKPTAFFVPLTAMFLSDLVLGLHALIPVIYATFIFITCLGFWVRRNPSAGRIGGAALAGAVLFFVITNFAVWATASFYPKTVNGLITCYAEALPFFWNTLTSDLFYAAILFGALRAAEWRWPVLRPLPAIN